ncbi:hypothetical protein LARV_01344 [Longilinea arvoryzae]|uniref:Uncharacterized protein n=1 Tax=Longilinea arvoryzae TaxID=360412 RepID=A0A0S7BII1_9CHLR|nr:hypothetical protein [Longilinea arvoryzae]GAP13589.1 hypothetical protein LARV_01344 [Longilinea arvoryzae]
MNEKQMAQIVEGFSRKVDPVPGQVKVTRVPDYKTVYVEEIDGVGRSIVMTEYQVDGKTYWAGYSMYSQTVFLSQASRD